jgi:exosome complex component RRP4
MGLIVKEKDFVIPGDVVAEGMDNLPGNGIYRDGDKLVAMQLGVVRVDNRLVKLIPLTGAYKPRVGDVVIGQVTNMNFNAWTIDINYSNLAMMNIRDGTTEFIDKKADLSRYYDFDDYVVAKILNIGKGNLIDLTMKGPGLMKLNGGRIFDVAPSKVPRVIGKQGSMISMLKTLSGCKMFVGQNGKLWVDGEKTAKVLEAVRLIERETHTSGLTEKVEKLLGGKK